MQNPHQAPQQPSGDRPTLSTEQLAERLGVKAQSVRQRLCITGEYFGLRPVKAPNRFLRWPADSAERLLSADREK